MAQSGALFSRTEVARLLNISPWRLANFADDRRYGYGLAPSVRGAKGRGKKGLYSLSDVYKVAVGYRMSLVNLSPDEVHEAIQTLFPKKQDPMVIAVSERRSGENARYLVVNLCALARARFETGLPDGSLGVEPPEWSCSKSSAKHEVVALRSRKVIAEEFERGVARAFIVLPFDELLNWIDGRILGREEIFCTR
jgi:hypothetical protein